MKHTWIVLGAALLLFGPVGCTNISSVPGSKPWNDDAEGRRDLLVGKWFGTAPLKGGGVRRWTNHRFADGTYVIVIRNIQEDGEFTETSEYGDWGLSGDVYFTVMRGWIRDGRRDPAPRRSAYYDDAYRVRSLTRDTFEYTSATSGRRYSVTRVPDDFSLDDSKPNKPLHGTPAESPSSSTEPEGRRP